MPCRLLLYQILTVEEILFFLQQPLINRMDIKSQYLIVQLYALSL